VRPAGTPPGNDDRTATDYERTARMAHLLRIDSSARSTGSVTRQLTAEFAAHWRRANPAGTTAYRDLGTSPVPHLTEATVNAMFVPPPARTADQVMATALQEELIAELAAADAVVIGVPMYNFSIPSALKAWIDHVVVFGRTVGQGLFEGTRVVVVTARGGAYGPGTPRAPFDYQEPYLRAILGLVGLTDTAFAHAEMRAAADGDPGLAAFVPFATESLAAVRAMIAVEAARPRTVPSPRRG
jgi:FMN-dependent NADH-azoreductase